MYKSCKYVGFHQITRSPYPAKLSAPVQSTQGEPPAELSTRSRSSDRSARPRRSCVQPLRNCSNDWPLGAPGRSLGRSEESGDRAVVIFGSPGVPMMLVRAVLVG